MRKKSLFELACVRIAIGVLFFGLCVVVGEAATVRYVNQFSSAPTAPYVSWATAATNISDAANISSSGDTILVTNGVYAYGGVPFNGSNRVYLHTSVTLKSVNGPLVTTIRGAQGPNTNETGAARCVYMDPAAVVSGFTLTGGATATSQAVLSGGGVYCVASSCMVSNCIITGNSAEQFRCRSLRRVSN